jgi:porin
MRCTDHAPSALEQSHLSRTRILAGASAALMCAVCATPAFAQGTGAPGQQAAIRTASLVLRPFAAPTADTVPELRRVASLDSTVAPKKLKRVASTADTTDSDSTDAAPRKTTQPLPFNLLRFFRRPGVTLSFEAITDASGGTSALSAVQSRRTHSDLALTLNLDSLLGWHGLTVYAQHKTKTGGAGSGAIAMVQNVSNIDADDFRSMGEVYAEQRLFRDRIRVKAGRVDFNNEFAGTDNGAGFLNASMGYSPSITAAPTFPLPTTGVNLFVAPKETFTLGVGIYDGRDGASAPVGGTSRFEIAQATQSWSGGTSARDGRVGVGAFRHTGMFASVTASPDSEPDLRGTSGWFATLDQTLWVRAHAAATDDERPARIGSFMQYGHSNPDVSGVSGHVGAGLTFAGLIPRRHSDVVGIGATRASWLSGAESIGEMYYQMPVVSHLTLIADLQRVDRHEGSAAHQAGMVATIRTVVSF